MCAPVSAIPLPPRRCCSTQGARRWAWRWIGSGSMATREEADEVIQRLRGVAGQLACGVTVVIALVDGEPHATTVSACTLVSFTPPLVAVFFRAGSRTAGYLRSAGRFSVSVLGGRDVGVARRCA